MLHTNLNNSARGLPQYYGMNADPAAVRATVAINLKLLMERRNWTQKELEVKSGVSQRHISSVRNQQQNCSIEILSKLGEAFGIPGWLLLIPGFSSERVQLLDSPQLPKLIDRYLSTDPEGRDTIQYCAEHEIYRSSQRKNIVDFGKSLSR